MTEPNLVILAGGVSSRMKQSGGQALDPRLAAEADTRSKAMIGLGEEKRPLLDYLLFNAREAGYRDVVIVTGERDVSTRQRYGGQDRGNSFGGLTISYAVQSIPAGRSKPLGTADALERALRSRPDWRGSHVTVCNSDNIYSQNVLKMLLEVPSGCAMADYDRDALGVPAERVRQYAVTIKDEQGVLRHIVEKPSDQDVERAMGGSGRVGVSMNVWRFPVDWILPCLKDVPLHPVRQEKELPVAVALFVERHPGYMQALPVAERVPDLTNKDDIGDVQAYISRTFPNFSFGRS